MGQHKDLLEGQTIGCLTAIEFHQNKNKKNYWWCKCSCGKTASVRVDKFKRGVPLCQCTKETINKKIQETLVRKREDLSGKKFGRLIVDGKSISKHYGKSTLWKCRCSCGNTTEVLGWSLKNGKTKSCGCLQRDSAREHAKVMGNSNKLHGKTKSREYEAWHRMKQRCNDPKCPSYNRYGGRGISVCERWGDSFERFFEDMGPRPSNKHSIDRINNNGNYEPGNCRWATQKEQQRNRSSNTPITYNGEIKCISEWAEQYGLPMITVWWRIRKSGWPVHKALTTPIKNRVK